MIKSIKPQVFLFFVSLFILSACNSKTNKNPSLKKSLANAEYPIGITKSGKAKLSDGHFEGQAAPDSTTKATVSLLPKRAWGDLNNDGKKDAAVILVGDGGGSGTFYYLSAVLNEKEGMTPIDSKLLGDRIQINSIKIKGGKIIIKFLRRAKGESMSSSPSIKTTSKFTLKNNTINKISESAT